MITRDPGTGERIRVLPFGFVVKGAAADPAAMLRMALTVGRNGLTQRIVVAWGAGASACNYTVDYSGLGTAPPIATPR